MSPNTLCRAIFFAGILAWIVTEPSRVPILTLAAILLHECGHLLAARLCHVKANGFFVDSLGARLTLSGTTLSYPAELIISAAGPFANLFSLPLSLFLKGDNAAFFVSVSLALALLNLMPIKGFDGGRIFYCLTALFTDSTRAERLCVFLSFFSLFVLWCVSVYLMLKAGADLSLFLFSISVFTRIFLQHKMP